MAESGGQEKKTQWLTTVVSALENDDPHAVQPLVENLHCSDSAHLVESLPPKERQAFWETLTPEQRAEILPCLHDEVRAGLLEAMETEELTAVAHQIETDDMADLLQDMSFQQTQDVLRSLDEQNRERLEEVLSYPEDTAGGLMNTDCIRIRPDISIDVVLRYLRMRGELPEMTNKLMVVDRHNTFLGELPISIILTTPPEVEVGEVMLKECEFIPAMTSDHEVADLFEDHNLVSAPVLDERGRLLGRITIDDAVEIIREEAERTLLSRAGMKEEEDTFAPIRTSMKRRTVWLAINLATAFLAAWVIGLFEHTLQQVIALAVLMPIVASMGGIAGGQTLTLVIRGMAMDQINEANTRWLILKELAVGVMNGGFWAVIVAAIAALWFGDLMLGLVIAAAMLLNLSIAALSGVVIPMVQKKMGIDPALAGYVVLTTVTDVVGFFSFLGLATLILL